MDLADILHLIRSLFMYFMHFNPSLALWTLPSVWSCHCILFLILIYPIIFLTKSGFIFGNFFTYVFSPSHPFVTMYLEKTLNIIPKWIPLSLQSVQTLIRLLRPCIMWPFEYIFAPFSFTCYVPLAMIPLASKALCTLFPLSGPFVPDSALISIIVSKKFSLTTLTFSPYNVLHPLVSWIKHIE